MTYVTLFSEITCDPEHASAAAETLSQLVLDTRLEPGCIVFDLAQHREQPNRFAVFEVFRDQVAFDEHLAADHLARTVQRMAPFGGQATYEFWNLVGELTPPRHPLA